MSKVKDVRNSNLYKVLDATFKCIAIYTMITQATEKELDILVFCQLEVIQGPLTRSEKLLII